MKRTLDYRHKTQTEKRCQPDQHTHDTEMISTSQLMLCSHTEPQREIEGHTLTHEHNINWLPLHASSSQKQHRRKSHALHA
jgi:hypothetical protein